MKGACTSASGGGDAVARLSPSGRRIVEGVRLEETATPQGRWDAALIFRRARKRTLLFKVRAAAFERDLGAGVAGRLAQGLAHDGLRVRPVLQAA